MLEDKELLQICYPVTEENWKDNSIYDGVVSFKGDFDFQA